MALLDAKEYDPRPAQKRRKIIATVVVLVLAVSVYLFLTRYDAEKKVIGNFNDYEFYTGESMNPDGMIALLNYRVSTSSLSLFGAALELIRPLRAGRWCHPLLHLLEGWTQGTKAREYL